MKYFGSSINEMLARFFIVLAISVAAVGYFGSAKAETKITLTDAVKQRLVQLPPLRGNGVNANSFDGRPILGTFFASW